VELSGGAKKEIAGGRVSPPLMSSRFLPPATGRCARAARQRSSIRSSFGSRPGQPRFVVFRTAAPFVFPCVACCSSAASLFPRHRRLRRDALPGSSREGAKARSRKGPLRRAHPLSSWRLRLFAGFAQENSHESHRPLRRRMLAGASQLQRSVARHCRLRASSRSPASGGSRARLTSTTARGAPSRSRRWPGRR
jgi:hypothetical protein